jgi:hypothetical protein
LPAAAEVARPMLLIVAIEVFDEVHVASDVRFWVLASV